MPVPSKNNQFDPRRPITPEMEILGHDRSEKTFLPDIQIASLLSHIDGHIDALIEKFRQLHARKYNTTKKVWDEDTEAYKTLTVPDVLDDQTVMERYPVLQSIDKRHAAFVKHYNSLHGFSTTSATRANRESNRQEQDDSAGTTDNEKWR